MKDLENIKKNVLHYWQFVWQRLNEDRCAQMASALTLTTLLSLVPLLTVIFTVLGIVPSFRVQAQEMMNYVLIHFLPTSADAIQSYLHQFTSKAAELTAVGSIFLFLTALIILANIEQALNTIWRTPVKRKGMAALILYWAILTLTPVLVVGSIAVTSYMSVLEPIILEEATRSTLWTKLLPILISIIAFTLLYVIVPNTKVPIKHALVGGTVAALLFEMGRLAFRMYITQFPNYQLLYGALAVLPIFAVWVYLSWVFVLFGAEITHALRYYYRKSLQDVPHFLIAYRWLGFLWEAQHSGQQMTLMSLLQKQPIASIHEGEQMMEELEEHGWVRRTAENDFVLARDFHEVNVVDLYRSINYPLPSSSIMQLQIKEQTKISYGDEGLLNTIKQIESAYSKMTIPTLAQCFDLENKRI